MLHRRVPLIFAPTPLHRLDKFSEILGIQLWIKRDDLTGFAGGGNKGRKLEFLIADIVESGCDTVVANGALQSNFLRQASAACLRYDLEFHAVTMRFPYPDPARKAVHSAVTNDDAGNNLLNKLLGTRVTLLDDGTWDELEDAGRDLAAKLRHDGKKVYEIPTGGSSGVGALGFVAAAEEVLRQQMPFDTIITASSSGATQTGLVYGFERAGVNSKVMGICADLEPEMTEVFSGIAAELDELLCGELRLMPADFDLRVDYVGPGYQVATPEAREAIELMARNEGIFLDPIYTAKAFAGVLDLARKGELKGRVLFWHTGGFPALFVPGFA